MNEQPQAHEWVISSVDSMLQAVSDLVYRRVTSHTHEWATSRIWMSHIKCRLKVEVTGRLRFANSPRLPSTWICLSTCFSWWASLCVFETERVRVACVRCACTYNGGGAGVLRLFVNCCIWVCGCGFGGGVLQCTAVRLVVCLCVLVRVYGVATVSRID